MCEFKITFPSSYQVKNVNNDNIDINIAFLDNRVFSATVFTADNIKDLMTQNNESFFWTSDMFIVADLSIDTIRNAISESLTHHYFELIFTQIGTVESVYEVNSFEDIIIYI